MGGTYASLAQSRFFSPAFNSALFDGPLRIYFAQFNEALALKIYFCVQQKFATLLTEVKATYPSRSCLVLLYPNHESFSMCFDKPQALTSIDALEGDSVIGINGPFEDADMERVLSVIERVLESWSEIGSLDLMPSNISKEISFN